MYILRRQKKKSKVTKREFTVRDFLNKNSKIYVIIYSYVKEVLISNEI